MIENKKRTIVVISVIAVIVLIAAVVVPTSVVLTKKNRSDDQSSSSSSSTANDAPLQDETEGSVPTASPSAPLPTFQPTLNPTGPPTEMPTSSPTTAPTLSPTQYGTPKSSLMLLAYYYPWYLNGDWSRHGYVDTPLLGLYGTDNIEVCETHIEWAQRAGIESFVVSWSRPDALNAQHLSKGLLNARNIGNIAFAINYESKMALPTRNFANGRALQGLIEDMKYIEENYFNHPSYLRINGRPVVVLYITRTWANFNEDMWDQVVNSLSEDVLFVADEPYFGRQKNPESSWNGLRRDGTPMFETYTTYNIFWDDVVKSGESATDFMFREGLPIFENWAKDVVLFPNVLPMYHDFRGHPPLHGDAEGLRKQLEKFWCLPRPSFYEPGTYPNMMFVTSFNEWWEGSQIEPDDNEKYGFSFIDTLGAFKNSDFTCPPPAPDSTIEETP